MTDEQRLAIRDILSELTDDKKIQANTIQKIESVLSDINVKDEYTTKETNIGQIESHPSYATLLFSRVHGHNQTLFGSSIKHNDIISMKIYQADLIRGLHHDDVFGKNELIEVDMSYSQFAEAITSMNMNSGVPVTLKYVRGIGCIPDCKYTNKKDQFASEMKDELEKAHEDSKALYDEVKLLFDEKKNITKADKTHILEILSKITAMTSSNIKFTCDMFNKQMDKTITEAKGEIEAFAQNKLNQIAMAALAEKPTNLIEQTNPVNMFNETNTN